MKIFENKNKSIQEKEKNENKKENLIEKKN